MNTATINSAKDAAGTRDGAYGSEAGKNTKDSDFFVNFLTAVGMTDPERLNAVKREIDSVSLSDGSTKKVELDPEDAGFIVNFLTAIGMSNPEKYADLFPVSPEAASVRAADIADLKSFFAGFLKAINKIQDQSELNDKKDFALLAGLVEKLAANISLKNNNELAEEAKAAVGLLDKFSESPELSKIFSTEIGSELKDKIQKFIDKNKIADNIIQSNFSKLPEDFKKTLEDASKLSSAMNTISMKGEKNGQAASAIYSPNIVSNDNIVKNLQELANGKTSALNDKSKFVDVNETFVFDTETGELKIREANISREAKNSTGDFLKNVLNLTVGEAKGEYSTGENGNSSLFSGMNFSKNGNLTKDLPAETTDNFDSYHTFSSVNVKDFASTVNGLARKAADDSNVGAKLILNPASLGTVFVEINVKDGIAKINIKTETVDAAKSLEGQISILKDKLAQNGIRTDAIQISQSSDNLDFLGQSLADQGRSGTSQEDRKTKRDFLNSFKNANDNVELNAGEIEQKMRLFAGKLVEKYV